MLHRVKRQQAAAPTVAHAATLDAQQVPQHPSCLIINAILQLYSTVSENYLQTTRYDHVLSHPSVVTLSGTKLSVVIGSCCFV